MAQQVYVTVATAASASRPDVCYTIKRSAQTGLLSCNCPAWIFQKGSFRKPCKHIKQMAAENGHGSF